MQNKRGQGLSTNAIILIVLGVVVLVVLIGGFTIGWGQMAPWIKTNNVNTIVQACSVACSTDNKYDYCTVDRELNDGSTKVKTDCNLLSKPPYTNYEIKECPQLTCTLPENEGDAIKKCTTLGQEIEYKGDDSPKHICEASEGSIPSA